MIRIHRYALLLDSRLNQIRPFPCLLKTRHGKPERFFYKTSPAVPPHINTSNIPPYKGYQRESLCEGVFTARSYSKSRQLKYDLLP